MTNGTAYPLLPGDVFKDTLYLGSYYGCALAGSNATLNLIEEY